MKFIVIVLCLLSERFLVHASSHARFQWFDHYSKAIEKRMPAAFVSNSWLVLLFIVLPLVIATSLAFYVVGNLLFGLVILLLNIAIFHYCIGPQNPFYPVRGDDVTHDEVGGYLAGVNGQLFAVIFWYLVMGPLGVVTYRVISLCQNYSLVHKQATWITSILDWLPTKITALLYLFAGNFQAGVRHFSAMFFTSPDNNQEMLSTCGIQAVGFNEPEEVRMPQAEILVEHAVIVLLVLLAFFTMAAWL